MQVQSTEPGLPSDKKIIHFLVNITHSHEFRTHSLEWGLQHHWRKITNLVRGPSLNSPANRIRGVAEKLAKFPRIHREIRLL